MTEVLMWHSKKPRRLRLRGFSIPFCRVYKGGNPYQSSFTADTGTYRLCADKVVCKRVYEVERILLN